MHFFFGLAEWLQRAGIFLRADHHKRRAAGVKGVQVEQHIVRIEQRAQHIGEAILKVLRNGAWCHVAVEVALAAALLQLVSEGVGDRHKGDAAAFNGQLSITQFIKQLPDGLRAAGFIAVNRTEYKQLRAGGQSVISEGAQVGRVGDFGHGGGVLVCLLIYTATWFGGIKNFAADIFWC